MNHIDEGTIHAWLDGSVDADRSREIEAHVAQCSTCGAAVAEARGLIAGASRILIALDDVPAGVTPMRAPAPPRREWRAARWVTSIAAALMLAIGITTWNRGAVQDQRPMTANPALDKVLAPAAAPTAVPATPPMAESVDSTATARVAKASAQRDADVARQPRVRESAPRLASKQTRAEDARAVGGATDTSRALAIAGVAGGAAPAPSAAPAELRRRKLADSPLQLSDIVVTSVPGKRISPASEANRLAASEMDRVAGCYRVRADEGEGVLMRATGAVAAEAKRAAGAAGAARAPSVAPAPARASVSSDFAAVQLPALLRLDTLPRPLGRAVRSATSDTTIGWWNLVGADSVRVDLLAAGRFTLAAKDRVSCPER